MRARIYVGETLVGEVSLSRCRGETVEREPAVGDRVVVAFVNDHPEPKRWPLFLEGRLEHAT